MGTREASAAALNFFRFRLLGVFFFFPSKQMRAMLSRKPQYSFGSVVNVHMSTSSNIESLNSVRVRWPRPPLSTSHASVLSRLASASSHSSPSSSSALQTFIITAT